MKKIILPIAVLAIFGMSSCGNSTGDVKNDSAKNDSANKTVETPKPKFEDLCKEANSLTMTIQDYKYDMKGKFAFAGPFEVKQSSMSMVDDSDATITLMNYAAGELVGARKDNQIDITVEIHGKHGKKITNGVYSSSSDKDMWGGAHMTTSKGTVYFNWMYPMPEVGTITVNFIGDGKACGSFSLASEKPTSDMVGTVRLSGNFKIGE